MPVSAAGYHLEHFSAFRSNNRILPRSKESVTIVSAKIFSRTALTIQRAQNSLTDFSQNQKFSITFFQGLLPPCAFELRNAKSAPANGRPPVP